MNTCPTMRRKLVTHSTLNIINGERGKERQEWVTEPCGVPLFGKEAAKGVCRGCERGWQTEHNYPV